MKALLFILVIGLFLVSCKKDLSLLPLPAQSSSAVLTKVLDTLPDGAFYKIRLQKDSSPIDETVVMFRHNAPACFNNSVDAIYFQGFGIASLSSLTCDNIPCAIQTLPFSINNTLRLKIGSKGSETYMLSLSDLEKFPAGYHIWLRDNLLKDSLDLRKANYIFKVVENDTTTFGTTRFKVTVR